MSELRHVYILGAGFSVPLGGPSFNQLISNLEQKVVADVVGDSTFPAHVFLRRMPSIVTGLWNRIGRVGEVNLEELLETIDYAAHSSQSVFAGEIIAEMNFSSDSDKFWNSRHISEISRVFRLRLAISTTSFLERIPADSERWLPYKEWFRDLTPMDTIITFNYDTVVEKAAALTDRSYFPSSSQSLWNPTHLTTPKQPLPRLLKLHGSADWFGDGDTSQTTLENVHAYRMRWNEYFQDKINILIGTPGLAKPSLSEGLFKPMWDQAARRDPFPWQWYALF